jgi:hypothetical protein
MISTITLFSGEDQSNPTGKQKNCLYQLLMGKRISIIFTSFAFRR